MPPQQAGKEAKRDTAGAVAIQVPYLRCVGLQEEAEGAHSTPVFTCARAQPPLLCTHNIGAHCMDTRGPAHMLHHVCLSINAIPIHVVLMALGTLIPPWQGGWSVPRRFIICATCCVCQRHARHCPCQLTSLQ